MKVFTDEESKKDSNTVLAISKAIIAWFAKTRGWIKKLSIRMDNAGCYHSQATIQGFWSLRPYFLSLGLQLMGVHFNEPGMKAKILFSISWLIFSCLTGGGKSRADTYAAITKHKVDSFVRNGGRADTARRFAEAIVSQGGLANVTVQLGKVKGFTSKPKTQIPNLRNYHQFIFDDYSIVARKVPGVGEGVKFDMEDMEMEETPEFEYELMNKDMSEDNLPGKRTHKEFCPSGHTSVEPEVYYEEEKTESVETPKSSELFYCEKPNPCDAKFTKKHNADKHNDPDANFCKIRVSHPKIKDKLILMSVQDSGLPNTKNVLQTEAGRLALLEMQTPDSNFDLRISLPMANTDLWNCQKTLIEQCPMGDALPLPKKNERWIYEVHKFLTDLFKEGEKEGGRHVRAAEAAEKMIVAKNPDGSCRIPWRHWKNETQVKYYLLDY